MPTFVTKTVGTGRDFATLKLFGAWLNARNLVTNDEMVTAECYNNLTTADSAMAYVPLGHDATRYCIIKPAPGLGVNDIETSGPVYYGSSGIEIVLSHTANFTVRSGVSLQGFRIAISGTSPDATATQAILLGGVSGQSTPARHPEVRWCRIKVNTSGAATRAIFMGEFVVGGRVTDNLFIHQSGNGLSANVAYSPNFSRNTFVRTGTAVGYSSTTGIADVLRNNVYLGCGAVPAIGLPASATTAVTNNFADTAMTGNAGGFTVATGGVLVENVASDLRPKAGSPLIGGAYSTANKTKDLRGSYRGTLPDVGAIQLTSQPLPALATAVILTQVVTDQTVKITGTTSGEVLSGLGSLSVNGSVTVGPLSVTTGTDTFEITFPFILGANYDAPIITFTNDGGVGPAATGGTAFVVQPAVMPVATVARQYLIGTKVVVKGTVTGAPKTGTVTLTPAATPNGAVAVGPLAVTIANGTFVANIPGITPGNYLAPSIVFTNAAGTSPAASGSSPVVVAVQTPAPIEGVNIQTIGAGKMHTTLKTFAAWLLNRDLVATSEMIHAYVYDDAAVADFANTEFAPATADASHYCLIKPAPGMGVNELMAGEPTVYGDVGVELNINISAACIVSAGVVFEGFRMKFLNTTGGTNKRGMYFARKNSTYLSTFNARCIRNRILMQHTGQTHAALSSGLSAGPGIIADNLIILDNVDGMAAATSYGTFERNTIVRLGASGVGFKAVTSTNASSGQKYRDNVFVGCGGIPLGVLTGDAVSNNITDTALTSAIAGVDFGANPLQNPVSDFKPAAAGPLIGTASANAISTNDLLGGNRGPAPDVGAIQRSPYVPLTVGIITSTVVDGTTVTITGTMNNNPTVGIATVLPDATNPAGAGQLGPTAVTLGNGTFTVKWEGVAAGNYRAPTIYFTNAGGISAAASGAQSFGIIVLQGSPIAGSNVAPTAPTVNVTSRSFVGDVLTVSGLVDLKEAAQGTLDIFIEPLPTGDPLGPFSVTPSAGAWTYSAQIAPGRHRIRAVAFANDITQVASVDVAVIQAAGVPKLPLK